METSDPPVKDWFLGITVTWGGSANKKRQSEMPTYLDSRSCFCQQTGRLLTATPPTLFSFVLPGVHL